MASMMNNPEMMRLAMQMLINNPNLTVRRFLSSFFNKTLLQGLSGGAPASRTAGIASQIEQLRTDARFTTQMQNESVANAMTQIHDAVQILHTNAPDLLNAIFTCVA